MQRMMPDGVSSYPGCLPQHRKCQYSGNVTKAANEESFPKKRCDYAQYNLPSNKSEGEFAYNNGSMTWTRRLQQLCSTCGCEPWRASTPFLSLSRYSQPFARPIFWVHLSAGVDPLRLRGQRAVAGQPASPPGLRPAESLRPGHLKPHIKTLTTVQLPELLAFVALSLLGVQRICLSSTLSLDVTVPKWALISGLSHFNPH